MDPIYVKSQKIFIFGIKLEPIYQKLQFEALRILGPNFVLILDVQRGLCTSGYKARI